MKHVMTIILAFIVSLNGVLAQQVQRQVQMFVDTTSIYEGDHVRILCHLFNLQSNNIALIEQETLSGDKIQWMRDGELKTDQRDGDPEVITVDTNANLKSYMLTFNAISRTNAGTYMCHAIELTEDGATIDATLLQSDSIEVVVNYLPSDQHPICSGDSSLIAGDNAKFTCMTQDGIPNVFLKWSHNSHISNFSEFYQRQLSQPEGTVQSSLDLIAEKDMNGTYFVCQIYSSAFPKSNLSCSIGPIFVASDFGESSTTSKNDIDKDINTLASENNTLVLLLIITIITIVVLVVFAVAVSISYCKRREKGKSPVNEILTSPPLPDRPSVVSRTSVERQQALESQPVSSSTQLSSINHYEETPPTPRSFPKRDASENRNSHYEHTPKTRRSSLGQRGSQRQSHDKQDSTDVETSDDLRPEHPYERTLSGSRRLVAGDQGTKAKDQGTKVTAVNNAYLELLE